MEKTMIGKKMWGIARKDSNYPICVHETKEDAIRSLGQEYTLLVELEIKEVSKMCVHFCKCEHECGCKN